MALQCFTWITELLGALFGTICNGEEDLLECLPDDLIIDILSRLPLDCLVRCQRDCRGLRAFISSHYFNTLYFSRARPMLLIQDTRDSIKHGHDLYMFGENLNNNKKMVLSRLPLRPELMINKNNKNWVHPPCLAYSCQGVLLFIDNQRSYTYYVINPITQEEVTVQHRLHFGYLRALYFCPLTREFRLLLAHIQGSSCQYLVYIFKTRSWRKICSSSDFNFLPRCHPPAIVNGALHWIMYEDLEKEDFPPCANGIMVFRMAKEELFARPHPGSVCNSKKAHKTMTLLVKEDCLSFCHLLIPEYAVDIWILEDYEMWAWNKKYKINLLDYKLFPFSLPFNVSTPIEDMSWLIKIVDIQDAELLLFLSYRGLFSYNLDDKTVKRTEFLPHVESLCYFRPYIKSLMAIV